MSDEEWKEMQRDLGAVKAAHKIYEATVRQARDEYYARIAAIRDEGEEGEEEEERAIASEGVSDDEDE